MIRTGEYRLYPQHYAVDLSSYRKEATGARATIRAVWFRKPGAKHGPRAACTGYLAGYLRPAAADAREFLERWADGRYGGDCQGRWNGTGYWGTDERPAVREQHLALLVPMLEAFPAIPDGWDGWYRF
jgi:hypothetical protein